MFISWTAHPKEMSRSDQGPRAYLPQITQKTRKRARAYIGWSFPDPETGVIQREQGARWKKDRRVGIYAHQVENSDIDSSLICQIIKKYSSSFRFNGTQHSYCFFLRLLRNLRQNAFALALCVNDQGKQFRRDSECCYRIGNMNAHDTGR